MFYPKTKSVFIWICKINQHALCTVGWTFLAKSFLLCLLICMKRIQKKIWGQSDYFLNTIFALKKILALYAIFFKAGPPVLINGNYTYSTWIPKRHAS